MTTIASLNVQLSADSQGFTKGTQAATAGLGSLQKQAEGSSIALSDAAKNTQKIAGALAPLGAAGGPVGAAIGQVSSLAAAFGPGGLLIAGATAAAGAIATTFNSAREDLAKLDADIAKSMLGAVRLGEEVASARQKRIATQGSAASSGAAASGAASLSAEQQATLKGNAFSAQQVLLAANGALSAGEAADMISRLGYDQALSTARGLGGNNPAYAEEQTNVIRSLNGEAIPQSRNERIASLQAQQSELAKQQAFIGKPGEEGTQADIAAKRVQSLRRSMETGSSFDVTNALSTYISDALGIGFKSRSSQRENAIEASPENRALAEEINKSTELQRQSLEIQRQLLELQKTDSGATAQ